ncbi:hypothetical protein BCF33_2227 [Hasllibacter halocynthiae]|uniref:Uncharacterized protein n=1 Tax=Hasllibacter halocynthiae TaxID=595589 RepID=A0A2T0X334_9RHOB|nr:hypothetical protein [Hasllibacter halocynthiae]PRY93359.1 hypothetical protein BCF33_2227 [Hasllibacter halocynthiae]
MTPGAFAARHPRLYRLAARGAAEGVRRHGLLPAAELARRAGADLPPERRPRAVPLRLPDGTAAVLTDNAPLSLARLARVLDDGLCPADWMRMLNARVFLWPARPLGLGNLNARRRLGYESEWQVFDTLGLLSPVWDRAEIAPINTGATVRAPARRGLATFAPLAGLDFAAWRRARREAGTRKGLDTPKEVTVRGAIPDAGAHLLAVEPAD